MAAESNQDEPLIITKYTGSIFSNKYLINGITLLVGIFIGFFVFSIIPNSKSTISVIPTPKQSMINSSSSSAQPIIQTNSLIGTSVLNNPIVYEWQGSIEGKLIKVNPDSYIIQDDKGNSITIYYKTPNAGVWKTQFFKLDGNNWVNVSINAIPIGSTLRGAFFILKDGPNIPIGSHFDVVK